jgi:hypothetical protein
VRPGSSRIVAARQVDEVAGFRRRPPDVNVEWHLHGMVVVRRWPVLAVALSCLWGRCRRVSWPAAASTQRVMGRRGGLPLLRRLYLDATCDVLTWSVWPSAPNGPTHFSYSQFPPPWTGLSFADLLEQRLPAPYPSDPPSNPYRMDKDESMQNVLALSHLLNASYLQTVCPEMLKLSHIGSPKNYY